MGYPHGCCGFCGCAPCSCGRNNYYGCDEIKPRHSEVIHDESLKGAGIPYNPLRVAVSHARDNILCKAHDGLYVPQQKPVPETTITVSCYGYDEKEGINYCRTDRVPPQNPFSFLLLTNGVFKAQTGSETQDWSILINASNIGPQERAAEDIDLTDGWLVISSAYLPSLSDMAKWKDYPAILFTQNYASNYEAIGIATTIPLPDFGKLAFKDQVDIPDIKTGNTPQPQTAHLVPATTANGTLIWEIPVDDTARIAAANALSTAENAQGTADDALGGLEQLSDSKLNNDLTTGDGSKFEAPDGYVPTVVGGELQFTAIPSGSVEDDVARAAAAKAQETADNAQTDATTALTGRLNNDLTRSDGKTFEGAEGYAPIVTSGVLKLSPIPKSGITAVKHDNTLTGDGNTTNLSVAHPYTSADANRLTAVETLARDNQKKLWYALKINSDQRSANYLMPDGTAIITFRNDNTANFTVAANNPTVCIGTDYDTSTQTFPVGQYVDIPPSGYISYTDGSTKAAFEYVISKNYFAVRDIDSYNVDNYSRLKTISGQSLIGKGDINVGEHWRRITGLSYPEGNPVFTVTSPSANTYKFTVPTRYTGSIIGTLQSIDGPFNTGTTYDMPAQGLADLTEWGSGSRSLLVEYKLYTPSDGSPRLYVLDSLG